MAGMHAVSYGGIWPATGELLLKAAYHKHFSSMDLYRRVKHERHQRDDVNEVTDVRQAAERGKELPRQKTVDDTCQGNTSEQSYILEIKQARDVHVRNDDLVKTKPAIKPLCDGFWILDTF